MRQFFMTAYMLTMLAAFAGAEKHPDKLVETKTMTGHLIGFQQGDYLHALIKTSEGRTEDFFLNGEECFLALNKNEKITVRYDVVSRYFSEGGGYYPAQIMRSLQAKGQDYRAWQKSSKESDIDCSELIEKYTISEESAE